MIDIAKKNLNLWRKDEYLVFGFAWIVLSGPMNIGVTTGQRPEPAQSSCWRLMGLLEYLALLDDDRKER